MSGTINADDLVSYVVVRVKGLLADIEAEDIVLPSRKEKVQYERKHKNMKSKGGKAPAEYTAVEIIIDLRAAMNEFDSIKARLGRSEEAISQQEVEMILRELVKGYLLIKSIIGL